MWNWGEATLSQSMATEIVSEQWGKKYSLAPVIKLGPRNEYNSE